MQNTKGRVLVIDGDADSLEMLAFLLRLEQFEVMTASTITQSSSLVSDYHFDLILLGDYYEDGTGVALCRLIRILDEITPIFFCSANAYPSAVEKAKQAGAQEYSTKPITPHELVASISQQLQQT